ncbi:MAG: Serine protease [Rhodanobacteraceae bacterium]|nr:MAG: Serine protease [Rhodanobacteraceae bacterium]
MKAGALLFAIACLAWSVRAHAQTGNAAASMDGERDIVLAVANPLDPPPTHAGSSLLGYVPSGNYGAGQRAASLLATLQQSYRWRELVGWPIKSLDVYCIVLEPAAGTSRDTLLAALARDKRVQLAEPLRNFSVYASGRQDARKYNDPYVDLQRGFVETAAARAQTATQGAGVDVAIVDTGADFEHPDLKGQIRDVHNLVDDDAAAFERDHHGTEVAGIIGAIADNHIGIVGMAPKARLSIYKACWYPSDSNGARCNSFTLAKALAAVMDTNARIVNLSLGGPSDPLLSRLLQGVLQRHVVIAALPPDGRLDGFPADVPGVIVVNASGSGLSPPGVLNAPGDDILTTQPDGGYDFTSGSSMAAAQVSGIAALLVSLDPDLDARAIHDLLTRTSTKAGGVLQVNAAAAVAALRRAAPSNHG